MSLFAGSRAIAARCLVVALAVGGSALAAGCGGDDDGQGGGSGSGSEKVTLQMAVPTGDQAYPAVIANFEKEHPDISVELQSVPIANYGQLLLTRLRSGKAADVFFSTPGIQAPYSVLNLVEAGYAADLSGLGLEVLDDVKPFVSKDGKLYSWPMGSGVIPAFYDEKTFGELGLKAPETFAELLAMCQQVREDDENLFLFPAGEQLSVGLLTSVLAAQNVYAAEPDWNEKRSAGEVTFADSPGWRRVFEQLVEMNEGGCFQDNPTGVNFAGAGRAWAKGDSVGTVGGNTGYLGILQAAAPDVQFSTFALPADKAQDTRVVLVPATNLVVNARSEKVEAAKQLVEFFAEPEQSRLWNEKEQSIAPVDQAENAPLPRLLAPLEPLFERDATMVSRDFTTPAEVFVARGSSAQGLLTGQKDVDEVLSDLDRAWDSAQPGS